LTLVEYELTPLGMTLIAPVAAIPAGDRHERR
jgi:DNA-binding HxlR family transcriptional regulator